MCSSLRVEPSSLRPPQRGRWTSREAWGHERHGCGRRAWRAVDTSQEMATWHIERQLRNATLAPSCASIRFLRSCAWCGCARILGTRTLVVTYRIPRHTRLSLSHSSGRVCRRAPLCAVEWSRGRRAYCYSCFVHGRPCPDPATYPTNPKCLHQGHCARSVRSAGSRSGRRMSLVRPSLMAEAFWRQSGKRG